MKRWMIPFLLVSGSGILVLADEKVTDSDRPSEGASAVVDPLDPKHGQPRMVQAHVEFVEMSHDKLTELLFLENPPSSDATRLRKTVAGLVEAGEASILETMMVVARSGEKASSESIREFIYPTEYEPSEIPDKVDFSEKEGGMSPEDARSLSMMVTQATPTSFETRNLGSTLEVAPNLGANGRLIDLHFSPEIVWHTGNTVWMERKDALGNVSKVEMPWKDTVK